MRITAIFLLAVGVHVSAMGYAQKVTLDMHDQPLEKIVQEISRQSGLEILYNNDLLKKAGRVSVTVNGVEARDALSMALSSTPFDYRMVDNILVISPKPKIVSPPVTASLPPGTITGRVTDANGKPLGSVSVVNRTLKKGVQTDANGSFSISGNERDLLEFSIVGYAGQTYKVGAGRTDITITMTQRASGLNEVVMIGYGSSQRKDLTGSVSTISGKEIQDVPYNTADNAIAGKAAGVQVTKTDGTPGGAVRIRVRGSTSILGGNDPLYVIDGVPVEVQSNFIDPGYGIGNPVGNDIAAAGGSSEGLQASFVNGLNSLGGLNPDDIESISILKDASASAIYGSKAANGVVIITTKKGRRDSRPSITFNYYGTRSSIMNKPHVLNKQQYQQVMTEAATNDNLARDQAGDPHLAQPDLVVNDPGKFFGNANTNWIDLVTRKPFAYTAEIAVQGGSASNRYYTSISYSNTPGIVIGTNYKRVVGKVNLETDITKNFRFITNFNLGYTSQDIADGAYDQALKARPDYAPYDSNGNFVNFGNVGASYQGFQNPMALTTAISNAKSTSLLGSLSLVYDIIPGLQFKSTVSLNDQQYNQRQYTPSYLEIGSYYGNVTNNGGIGSNSNSRFADWFVENTLGYTKKWIKHSVDILGGTSYETRKNSFFSATAQGYPNDNTLNGLSSAATPLFVKGDDPTKPQSYLLSFYLRANYTFNDKYLFTFTGRTDGSSKFGPDNKYGWFPSGAVAWRLSKEKFLEKVSWIEDLKVRGSYGLTGNQNIGNQMYRTLFSPFTYNGSNALVPTQLGNPGIKWETTRQGDVGVDISLFGGRLQGTLDYYDKETHDALLNLPVPPSSSYSSLLYNVVGIRNRGEEISLQGDIVRSRNFRWNMSANISWNKSLVTKLSSTADITDQLASPPTGLEYGNTTLIQGQPLGLILGMKVEGIVTTQKQLDDYRARLGQYAASYFPYLGMGDPIFALDTPTTYGRSPLIHTVIANGAPKYFGGFTETFSYKQWDLGLNFLFSGGGKLLWGDDAGSMAISSTANMNASILKRWTPQNPNATRPRLLWSGDQLIYSSNLNVYNSSYLKLRTVTLDYRFKQVGWMKRMSLQNATVYMSATNLFTITKYPGNDPETSDDSYSVAGGYFDVSNYPNARTISAGIKVTF